MLWMWIGLGVVGLVVLLVVVVVGVGASLPREHRASRELVLPKAPEVVWALITGAAEIPSWRRGVTRVEVREGSGWTEHSRHGAIPLAIEVMEPPRKLVTRIADDKLPFGGAWIYEITPTPEGCRLRITEDGFVGPAAFRFMSRYVFGHGATIEGYLRDVAARLGVPPAMGP